MMLLFMPLSQMPHWTVIVWFLWMIVGGVMEIIGLLRKGHAVPLTWVVRDILPRWAAAAVVGWLFYHFVVV